MTTKFLKKIACVIIVFCVLTGGSREPGNRQEAPNLKKNFLKGTLWTSDFHHYHNNYYFTTDSTGFSQNGQFLWSTPVDPASYNNSRDSISYEDDAPFRYSLKDTVLLIKYTSATPDSPNKNKIFYMKKGDGKILFMSDYQYTYGHEYLDFNKRIDK